MPNVLGAFGTVRNFMSIVKEVDFDAVRGRAETPPSVLVCASVEGIAGAFVRQVFGEDAERHVDVRTQWFGDIDGSKYDLVIVPTRRRRSRRRGPPGDRSGIRAQVAGTARCRARRSPTRNRRAQDAV